MIWFNLLLVLNGQMHWVESVETLEECLEVKEIIERNGGDYYCYFVDVEDV